MFNYEVLLKTLPDIWLKSFDDLNMLKAIYKVVGSFISDNYKDITKELATLSLEFTEQTNLSTWQALDLVLEDRIELTNLDKSEYLTVYPMVQNDPYLINCSRIYPSCTIDSNTYLEASRDYEILFSRSKEIEALSARFNKASFFNRYECFLVLKNKDPLVEDGWQIEPSLGLVGVRTGFKLLASDLSANDIAALVPGSRLELEVGETKLTTEVMATSLEDGRYTVVISTSDRNAELNSASLRVTLSTGNSFNTKVNELINVESNVSRVWAYSCEVDNLELHKRYGWLLPNNVRVLSSKNYRDILVGFKKANLLGLSKNTLTNIISLLLGGEKIINDYSVDSPVYLNLVSEVLRTTLEEYSFFKSAYISDNLISSTPLFVTKQGSFTKSSCFFISVPDFKDIIHSNIANEVPVELRSDSQKLGTLVLTSATGKFLGIKESAYTSSLSSYVIRIGTANIALTNSSQFSLEELPSDPGYAENELINTFVSIDDYSSGDNWWHTKNITIPNSVWSSGDSGRNRVTTDQWDYTIGNMRKHRIGDYDLAIPTVSGSKTFETSYKLTRDFLENKLVSVTYLQAALNNSNMGLSTALKFVEEVKQLGNLIITSSITPLLEYVEAPQETVSVTVTTTPSSLPEQINSAQNTGIGNSDILAYITLQNASHGITTSTSGITINGEPATCLAVSGPILVLSLGSTGINIPTNLTMLQVDSTTLIIQSGFFTNVIGSTPVVSKAMVVGNSYPEYPRYFPIGASTISQNLFIEVT